MTTVWSVLVPLAQKPPNPNNVVAGGLGAVVLLALVAAVVVLGFSLRKHLNKVNFDDGSAKPEQPKDEPKRDQGNGNGQASHAPSS